MKLYTRLFLYFSIIFIFMMGIITLFQYSREKEFRSEQLDGQLTTYNALIANYINAYQPSWQQIEEFVQLLPDSNLRVTVIDLEGEIIYDSSLELDSIKENHLMRPEIMALQVDKIGKVIRNSETLGLDFYYIAQNYGNIYVRSALPYQLNARLLLKANLFFLYVMAAILPIVMLVLYIISKGFSISVQEGEEKLKRELTQNISHELKTPVSSILGYMESLLDNPDLPHERQYLFVEKSYHQAQRLRALLQDISTLNKLDESRNLYQREQCEVNTIVHEVLVDLQMGIEERKIKVLNKLPDDITLRGNRTLIYSIFRNLIDNAINYAGEGTTITIALMSSDKIFYHFSVADNGVGIPNEHLSRIFERFYRVDKGRSRKLGGTGLGLSIVKNGVLFHHGKISAHNITTGGVQFLFTLRRF